MAIAIDKLTPEQLEEYIHISAVISRQEEAQAKTRTVRDYYDGYMPVMLTQRQQEYLGPLLTEGEFPFAHNICKTVVDLVKRLRVEGFTINGQDAGDLENSEPGGGGAAWAWWTSWRMDGQQNRLYKRTIRDGYSYVMVDYDSINKRPRATLQPLDDGVSGIVYHRDPDDLNRILFATKYFGSFDPLAPGKIPAERKTVYLPHEIHKYQRTAGQKRWTPTQDVGDTDWPLPWRDRRGEPLGVPVFEFQDPDGGMVGGIVGLQNALNKSWLDLLAAADTAGFPLMVVEYDKDIPVPADKGEDADLEGEDEERIAPGRAIDIYGGKFNRTEGADLSHLIDLVWTISSAVASVSNLPQHELRPQRGVDFPSGEALKQAESGLVAMVEERQLVFGQSWADVMAMARKVEDTFGQSVPPLEPLTIAVQWRNAETRMDKVDAETAKMHKELGVPDSAVFTKLGYTPEQIAQFEQEKRREAALKVAAVVSAVRVSQQNTAPGREPPGRGTGSAATTPPVALPVNGNGRNGA